MIIKLIYIFQNPAFSTFWKIMTFFPFSVFCNSHLAKTKTVCPGLEKGFAVTKQSPSPLSLSWALTVPAKGHFFNTLQFQTYSPYWRKRNPQRKVLNMHIGVQSLSRPPFLASVNPWCFSFPEHPTTVCPQGFLVWFPLLEMRCTQSVTRQLRCYLPSVPPESLPPRIANGSQHLSSVLTNLSLKLCRNWTVNTMGHHGRGGGPCSCLCVCSCILPQRPTWSLHRTLPGLALGWEPYPQVWRQVYSSSHAKVRHS